MIRPITRPMTRPTRQEMSGTNTPGHSRPPEFQLPAFDPPAKTCDGLDQWPDGHRDLEGSLPLWRRASIPTSGARKERKTYANPKDSSRQQTDPKPEQEIHQYLRAAGATLPSRTGA